jgi:hypothetical protein
MVRRYLDTTDAKSTSNLRKHAKICWGEEAVAAADQTRDVLAAREASHRQHTTTETRCVFIPQALGLGLISLNRAEIVRWVAEGKRPIGRDSLSGC